MQKTINDLSEIELKAIKSDLYETIAKCQNDLQVINQELSKRSKADPVEEIKEEVEKSEE